MSDNDYVINSVPSKGPPGLEPTLSLDSAHRIGAYELKEELGRGGMGIVYRARSHGDGTSVAIKLMSGHLIDDVIQRKRFLREARAAASISHPNIVRVHGIFEEETQLAIVMDYIEGGTLRSRLRSVPRREGDARSECDIGWVVRIAKQIARGLAAAHQAGVIHRDIKPSNILLDRTGEHAWIADFGLAAFECSDDSLTSTGRQLGTPAYMSPEQARGERVDRRSDLFSFGCLIYAMATGESPFHAGNQMAMMNKICEYTPASLAERVPQVSIAFARVVERLLKKGPADRFQQAEEVIEALACVDDGSGAPPRLTNLDLAAIQKTTILEGQDAIQGKDGSEFTHRYRSTIDDLSTQPSRNNSLPTLSLRRKWFRRATLVWFGVLTLSVLAATFLLWSRTEPPSALRKSVSPKPEFTKPLGRRRTVSAVKPADFTSLRDAIDSAQPNDTIEVVDGAIYDGPFVIDDPYRLEGVRLLTKSGASLRAEGNHGRMGVVSIEGVRRVHLEGFKIVGSTFLHSIYLRGNITGTTLSGLHVVQPADAQWANVLLSRECRGSVEEPIRIQGCQFASGKFGLFCGRDDIAESLELSHLLLNGNRFTGNGTHLVLMYSASEVRIEHNLFEGGQGIELNLGAPRRSGPFSIVNNTFHRTTGWIHFVSDRNDYEGFAANNLIVETTDRPWEAFGPKRASWRLEHNVWESPEIKGVRNIDGFGWATHDVGLVSRDAASPDFLRPKSGGIAASAGGGPPELGYVGARLP